MWIEEIFIHDFGAWHQLRLDGLQPGLNLVRGPNEAGKTTILEFVRSVFVGFSRRTGRMNPYEPGNRALRCGWLHLRTSTGDRLRFERVEKQGARNGILTVTDDQGRRIESSGIAGLAEGMDTSVFDSLFAFDLDRLRQMDHTALRAKIVATALGSSDTNPLDVIKSVDERLKALARRQKGNEPSFLALQQQLRDVDKGLKRASQLPETYETLKKQSEEVNQRLDEISHRSEELEALLGSLTATLRCEEPWLNFLDLDGKIAELADAQRFPADGMLRLERALEREQEIRDQLTQTREALEQASHKFDGLTPDPHIAAHLDLIERLSQRAAEVAAIPETIDQTSVEIGRATEGFDEQLSALHIGQSRQDLSEWRLSAEQEEEIPALARSCVTLGESIRTAEKRLEEINDRIARLTQRIAAMRREVASLEPEAAAYLDGESRRKLRTCIDAGQAIRHLQERLSDKSAVLRNLLQERDALVIRLKELNHIEMTAMSVSPLITGMLVAAAGSGILSYIVWRIVEASWPLAIGAGLGFLGTAAGIAVWRLRGQRSRAREAARERETVRDVLQRCRKELLAHDSQRRAMIARLTSWRSAAQDAAREVLGDPHASHQAIVDAQQRADAAEIPFRRLMVLREELHGDTLRLQDEQKLDAQLTESLRVARSGYARAHSALVDQLSQMGLPADTPPAAVPELTRRLPDLAVQARSIARAEDHLARMNATWEDFAAEVATAAAAMCQPVDAGMSPAATVRSWAQLALQTRDLQARREACAEQMRDLQDRGDALSQKAREVHAEIDALLQAAGVTDEESFREQGRRNKECRVLEQKRAVLSDNLVSVSGQRDEAELSAFLRGCDWERIREDRKTLLGENEALQKEARELATREGRLLQEIETLESVDEIERLSAQKEGLVAQVNDAVKEWTELRLASLLLEQTLRIYELEKQPKVLERTSEIFRAITGGAFSRVLFPFHEDRVKVERRDGTRLDEAVLSRGTLEQLYLAVRLAYLEVYRPGDFALPLLMDDILVNFDAERAGNTARILEQLSGEIGLQVLFFTCHAHVADLFSDNVVEVQLGSQQIPGGATSRETSPVSG